jgi:hypothetical protein
MGQYYGRHKWRFFLWGNFEMNPAPLKVLDSSPKQVGDSTLRAARYSGKVLDKRRENRRIGVAGGDLEEKRGGCEESILPVGGKSEEAADLKKYLKMLLNLHPCCYCSDCNIAGLTC